MKTARIANCLKFCFGLSLLVMLLILYAPEWEALKTCIRRPSMCAEV